MKDGGAGLAAAVLAAFEGAGTGER
jgi:hypothetical protein